MKFLSEKNSLLQGKMAHHFLRYVSLNVLSMLGLSLYVLADTYFIANGVGTRGLAALNLVLPVYSFVNGIGLMLGMGGATHFSMAQGQGNHSRGSVLFSQMLLAGGMAGVLLTLMGIFASRPLVMLLGASEEIVPLASSYIQTILSFSIAFLVNNICICFVRNDGAPHLSMAAMLTASMSNIVLDYIFVFPLHMGMFGAAFATGLSPVISLCVLSIHWFRGTSGVRICRPQGKWREFFRVAATGAPSFVTEFSYGIVMLLFNITLLAISGNTAVAAYGIITNIALVCMAMFNGIGQGIQPIISVYYGAGKPLWAQKVYRYACFTALIFGVSFLAAGWIFPEWITSVFNGEKDPYLAELAIQGIRITFVTFLFMGINIVTISYFACIGQSRSAFLISIMRGIVAVVPSIAILSALWGIDGVWSAMPAAEAIAAMISLFLITKDWKQKQRENLNH